ncbi:MAG: hypothetical protein HC853_08655 [Anaerolineae bacterium]|nr:hypothetical protein [Anaerolineae bacterium]
MTKTLNTLTANIKREWLARILDGSKRIEYRDATDYWLTRLDKVGPPPFKLRLINGMKPDSPEATVLVDKVDIDVLHSGEIRLHIAKILETVRWDAAWHADYPPMTPDPPWDLAVFFRELLVDSDITLDVSQDIFDSVTPEFPITFTLHSLTGVEATDTDDDLIDLPEENFTVRLVSNGQARRVAMLGIYERYLEGLTDYVVIAAPNEK